MVDSEREETCDKANGLPYSARKRVGKEEVKYPNYRAVVAV